MAATAKWSGQSAESGMIGTALITVGIIPRTDIEAMTAGDGKILAGGANNAYYI